ncbi:LytR C-terminal domain-containing protein [Actinoplanes bogorensis]|uniref:LytR C-terminal domain-containing protein n=1 Tax=Paractinoplanes bogorensis TaxID=1610840 RepID=A0ABS5YLL7_9ACTN|nr:LytR C-terminal domain-containing protein [Actinoplanes bogorensis]MBU2663634.1 LytR C-terminal domain-containing protein [Actinoplanes bogorensis]
MSGLPERLRELEAEIHDMPVAPAADIRARGRSRRRRRLAAISVAGAVVLSTAGAALAWPQPQRTEQPPVSRTGMSCALALPDSPADVKVRVLDGGAGRLGTTVTQLEARGFTVLGRATVDTPPAPVSVHYGPAAIGAATLLRAALHGDSVMVFEPDRRDDIVNLVLGPDFQRLATPTELNQNLVTAGEPTAPPEC